MADYIKQVNTDITFNDTSQNSPTSFYWDFGDGTSPVTIITSTTTHKYTTPGIYAIIHKSINDCGTGECTLKTIEITTEPPLKWKCSGSPDYTCTQATDGTYNTEAECTTSCKAPSEFGMGIAVVALGLGALYTILAKKK